MSDFQEDDAGDSLVEGETASLNVIQCNYGTGEAQPLRSAFQLRNLVVRLKKIKRETLVEYDAAVDTKITEEQVDDGWIKAEPVDENDQLQAHVQVGAPAHDVDDCWIKAEPVDEYNQLQSGEEMGAPSHDVGYSWIKSEPMDEDTIRADDSSALREQGDGPAAPDADVDGGWIESYPEDERNDLLEFQDQGDTLDYDVDDGWINSEEIGEDTTGNVDSLKFPKQEDMQDDDDDDGWIESEPFDGDTIRSDDRSGSVEMKCAKPIRSLRVVKKEAETKKEGAKLGVYHWSKVEKDDFFQALNRYGRDLDAVHRLMARKRCKRADQSEPNRTRTQVGNFYKRIATKATRFSKLAAGKESCSNHQDLRAILGYGVVRKRLGCDPALKRHWKLLARLIHNGEATSMKNGRTSKLKIPAHKGLTCALSEEKPIRNLTVKKKTAATRKEQVKKKKAGTRGGPVKKEAVQTNEEQMQTPGHWTEVQKSDFFEALFKYGHNIDAIHKRMGKKRRRRADQSEHGMTRLQVRYFYRSITKKALRIYKPREGLCPKHNLLLMLNYAELRRKFGRDPGKEHRQTLKNLLSAGVATLKQNGCCIRLKSPACKALTQANSNGADTVAFPCKLCVKTLPTSDVPTPGRSSSVTFSTTSAPIPDRSHSVTLLTSSVPTPVTFPTTSVPIPDRSHSVTLPTTSVPTPDRNCSVIKRTINVPVLDTNRLLTLHTVDVPIPGGNRSVRLPKVPTTVGNWSVPLSIVNVPIPDRNRLLKPLPGNINVPISDRNCLLKLLPNNVEVAIPKRKHVPTVNVPFQYGKPPVVVSGVSTSIPSCVSTGRQNAPQRIFLFIDGKLTELRL